jgi:hypothetical protein
VATAAAWSATNAAARPTSSAIADTFITTMQSAAASSAVTTVRQASRSSVMCLADMSAHFWTRVV